jgi:hypothetical protein
MAPSDPTRPGVIEFGAGGTVKSILLNVVGGLLTVWITAAYWFVHSRLRRRKFRKVFGHAKSYFLCYGALILNPQVRKFIPQQFQKLADFPLTRRSNPALIFSADTAVSACEIRAASYVSSSLGQDGGVSAEFASDEVLAAELDIDIISFGAMNNGKTLDLFSNNANDLAEYDVSQRIFVWKKDRSPLYSPLPNCDYGIIQKIHPEQFPDRTWITCAGIGEWGTSGSAWFLSKRWKKIAKEIRGQDRFVCVIQVEPTKDQSATLIATHSR